MKKTVLSLLLSLQFLHLVNSQTVFSEFKIPAYGTTVSVKFNSFTGNIGTGGLGQVWDFSKETYPNGPVTISIVDPKTTAYSSDFPSATHSETNPSGVISYAKLTENEYSVFGVYNPSVDLITYSDPLTTLRPPISYNQTQKDNFKATYNPNDMPMVKTGNYEVTYDGFGSLITPNGRYSDVIRMKATQTDIDTLAMDFGIPEMSLKYTTVSTTYFYYLPGYTHPLFSIINIKTNGQDGGTSSLLYDPVFLSGKDAIQKNMHVDIFPNPAKDFISVNLSKAEGKNFDVTIIDQLGTQVYQNKMSGFEKDILKVDLNGFEKGAYIMKISNEETSMVEKIVIQ